MSPAASQSPKLMALPKKEASSNMPCCHPSHPALQWPRKGRDKFLLIYQTPYIYFLHPKSPPNEPNSEEPVPALFLVMFTYVYIFPPNQNPPLQALPYHPAPTASKTPYPAPENETYPPRHPRQQNKHVTNFGWWAVAQLDVSRFWAIPGI
jgi:hypothetical protein